jgi:hypothetical protein
LGKYVGMTRIYLVVLTVFVVARFGLEAAGVSASVASELSVTRLYFVLPVFLGIRFATESLGGLKEMLLANFTYLTWGTVLLNLAVVVEAALDLGTHYIFAGVAGLLITIVAGTFILTLICWMTMLVNRKMA